jgi:prepilin-type N-terminal cleavage/methylation domain-containing protein
MKSSHPSNDSSAGFTVIELMIASLVFSVILVVITVGVLSFTNRYYKGVNSAATQAASQSVIDTVTQAMQFGNGSVDITGISASPAYFCAGGSKFVFDKGEKYTESASQKGFYVEPQGGAACNSTVVGGGRQLLGKNMRLADLAITSVSTRFFSVDITVAYGDDDLLCAPSIVNSCTTNAPMAATEYSNRPDITCKPTVGTQFCAVSRLKTSVEKRVGN